MKTYLIIFAIIGHLWVLLFVINGIISLVNLIINELNRQKMIEKIKNGNMLQKAFEKMTPEEKLKYEKGKSIKTKLDIDLNTFNVKDESESINDPDVKDSLNDAIKNSKTDNSERLNKQEKKTKRRR